MAVAQNNIEFFDEEVNGNSLSWFLMQPFLCWNWFLHFLLEVDNMKSSGCVKPLVVGDYEIFSQFFVKTIPSLFVDNIIMHGIAAIFWTKL
jgi:hypothetical protein